MALNRRRIVETYRRRAANYDWTSKLYRLTGFREDHYRCLVLSTCAITLVPEYDAVIARGAAALAPGGRLVVFDLKEPERWPEWAIDAYVALSRPFAVTRDLGERRPWESIARHLPVHAMTEIFGGAAYVAVGEKERSA